MASTRKYHYDLLQLGRHVLRCGQGGCILVLEGLSLLDQKTQQSGTETYNQQSGQVQVWTCNMLLIGVLVHCVFFVTKRGQHYILDSGYQVHDVARTENAINQTFPLTAMSLRPATSISHLYPDDQRCAAQETISRCGADCRLLERDWCSTRTLNRARQKLVGSGSQSVVDVPNGDMVEAYGLTGRQAGDVVPRMDTLIGLPSTSAR